MARIRIRYKIRLMVLSGVKIIVDLRLDTLSFLLSMRAVIAAAAATVFTLSNFETAGSSKRVHPVMMRRRNVFTKVCGSKLWWLLCG